MLHASLVWAIAAVGSASSLGAAWTHRWRQLLFRLQDCLSIRIPFVCMVVRMCVFASLEPEGCLYIHLFSELVEKRWIRAWLCWVKAGCSVALCLLRFPHFSLTLHNVLLLMWCVLFFTRDDHIHDKFKCSVWLRCCSCVSCCFYLCFILNRTN